MAVSMDFDGRSGVWLAEALAAEALEAYELEPVRVEQIQLLERRLTLKQAELDAVSEERDLFKSAAESLLPDWYEHPALWLGVGILAGGAVGVALAM